MLARVAVSVRALSSLAAFAQSPILSVTKTADATPVPTGTTIGLTITLGNSNAAGTGIATNVILSDFVPGTGLTWSISPAYTGPGNCTITDTILCPQLLCNFGNLSPGAQATVHIQSPTAAPQGSRAGTYAKLAKLFADNEQTVSPATATIVVNPPPPTVMKTFGAATIPLNGKTSATFVLTNPNWFPLTGISFSDTLPAGLIVSTPNELNTTCSGSITANAGSNRITFSGGTLVGNGSCMFSVNVTGIAPGVQNNTTGPISSNESGPMITTSNTASLTVVAPATITKTFADSEIQLFGLNITALSFTLKPEHSSTDGSRFHRYAAIWAGRLADLAQGRGAN